MAGKSITELDNTSVLRQMQLATATPNRQAAGPYFYALYLVNVNNGVPIRTFGFDIPPQSIRVGEDFASDIAAGQEGGFWMDDRGQYFKMLQISGAFGFRPTRNTGQILGGALGSLPSRVVRSAQQLQDTASALSEGAIGGVPKMPDKEKSGFDRLRDLMNLFRLYGDLKKYRDTASQVVMVWANWKTGEVYLAQPLRWERDRTAPSGRFQYKYSFSLRLVKPLQVEVPRDFFKNAATLRGRTSWIGRIKKAAAIVSRTADLVSGAVSASLDLARDITDSILSVANASVDFADTLLNQGHAVLNFPLEEVRKAHAYCQDVAKFLHTVDKYKDTQSRLSREFLKMGRAFADLWVGLSFFAQGDVNDEAAAYQRKYNSPFLDEDDAESLFRGQGNGDYNFGQNTIPSGRETQLIPEGATIRTMAARYLGSSARWKEIALMNNLQYPYIDRNGDGTLVLRPGDRILIPKDLSDADENGIVNTGTKNPNDFDFGWDLKVDLKSRQFVVDSGGDLDIVGGKDNLRQALSVKIWTEPGELVLHPWFGFEPNVGDAMTIDLLAQYHLQMKTTLLSDTRIERIKYLSFRSLGDQLFVNVLLVPKGQDSEVALSTLRVGAATTT